MIKDAEFMFIFGEDSIPKNDFEIAVGEDPREAKFRETLGIRYVLKRMEKVFKTDNETIEKAMIVLDALSAPLKEMKNNGSEIN